MNSCEHYQELISRLVDDDVSREEYDELLAHMNTCSRCSAIYAVFYDLDEIIASEEAEELPEGLHENIMAGVRRSEIEKKNRRARTVWRRTLLTAAACAALVLFAVRGLSPTDRVESTVVRSVETAQEQAMPAEEELAAAPAAAAPAPIPKESPAPTPVEVQPTPEPALPTTEEAAQPEAQAPAETPTPKAETPPPTQEPVNTLYVPAAISPSTPAPAAAEPEPTPQPTPEPELKPTPAPIESAEPTAPESESVEEPVATASIQLGQGEGADAGAAKAPPPVTSVSAEGVSAAEQEQSVDAEEEKRMELPRVAMPQELESLTAPEPVESAAPSASPAPSKSESIRIAKEENRQKLQLLLSGKEAPMPEQLPDKSYELTLISGDAYGSEEQLSIRVIGSEVYYLSTVGGTSKSFLAKCSPAELDTLLSAVRADERAPASLGPGAAPASTPAPTVTPDPYLGTPDPAAMETK